MKLNQIIKNVATILGLIDVVELLASNAKAEELDENLNYRVLMRAGALVLANLGANFKTPVTQQTFLANVTNAGRFSLNLFNHPPLAIKDVSAGGRTFAWELFSDHLRIIGAMGHVDVTYTFSAAPQSGEESLPLDIRPEIVEYGILSEFAFINGMFNEAQVWNTKMRELLFQDRSSKSIVLPRSFQG